MSEPGSEAQVLQEEIERIEQFVEEQCRKGYRGSMMLMVERIIEQNGLQSLTSKSAYQARKDGDWYEFIVPLYQVDSLQELHSWEVETQHSPRYWNMPPMWRSSLKEEIEKKRAQLEEST